MKKLISFLVIIIIGIGVFFLFNNLRETQEQEEHNFQRDSVSIEYKLENEGILFEYQNDYHIEERDITESDDPYLMRELVLMPVEDYNDQIDRVGGEESPSWRLAVYNNHLKQSASVWTDAHPSSSSVHLAIGEINRDDVFAGANAVSYSIDGLYRADVIVVANGDFIFVISSSYIDKESRTAQDFEAWIDSFEFIPTTNQVPELPRRKIDVRVACESALAYTTFMNSEDVEIFLQECIDGNHPDVIERYIESLGVDGARI